MREQDNEWIHPVVRRVLRVSAAVLLCLTLFISAKMAFTFCLGLFADGEHVVHFPGQGSPIVLLEDIVQEEEKTRAPAWELTELSRVEIAVAGDMMLQMPIVNRNKSADGYHFDDIFCYVAPYLSAADYAVSNLETTFAGLDGKSYTGDTKFNSPDDFAFTAKDAGFDMLLTGNEHCYDYGTEGLLRTLKVLRNSGITALGTVEDARSSRHKIVPVGEIQVGMASYTFAGIDDSGNVTLNNMTTDESGAGLINAFDEIHLSRFYTEIEGELAAMKAGGADVTVLFVHWGEQYSTAVSDVQKSIAQELCDLGVDVIVGSHPHVVQPLELLTSSADPFHNTVCMYSAGNLLSDVRAKDLRAPTSHCEDGLIFTFTLVRYSDGSVRVNGVKVLPTWVLVRGSGDVKDFYILPLDKTVTDWQKAFVLSDEQFSDATNSYNRTMALVTPGLNKIAGYVADQNGFLDPNIGVG